MKPQTAGVEITASPSSSRAPVECVAGELFALQTHQRAELQERSDTEFHNKRRRRRKGEVGDFVRVC